MVRGTLLAAAIGLAAGVVARLAIRRGRSRRRSSIEFVDVD